MLPVNRKTLAVALSIGGAVVLAGTAAWKPQTSQPEIGQSAIAPSAKSGDTGRDAEFDFTSANSSGGPSVVVNLPLTTQGPLWPPSGVMDKNGDFVVIGNTLEQVQPGVIGLFPLRAVIVSKNTVPPLDANGVEDPTNWFGAPFKIVRTLDLGKHSPDLDMELYSTSYGPFDDGISGAPRIPRAGESPYNLNKAGPVCTDAFATEDQKTTYTRPSYPMSEVPVLGFQGDGVAYDATTGAPYDPNTASDNPACAATGCPGEDAVDTRDRKRITLRDWLKAKGKVRIQLTKPKARGQYTHASFEFVFNDLLPNSIYTIGAPRNRQIPVPGVWQARVVDQLAIPNVIVTDEKGHGRAKFELENPFPDPATDTRGLRLIGLSVLYHSDHQNWGGCFSRFGTGVDSHPVFSTFNAVPQVPGTLAQLTDLVTVAP